MPGLQVDVSLLREFEKGLNVRWPERSRIPARVLGYGEIGTTLEIGADGAGPAYKRLPMFRTETEASSYETLYREYVGALHDRVGIRVVPGEMVRFQDEKRKPIVYIVQEKLPPDSIGHRAIHHLSPGGVERLTQAVLRETQKVFDFNRAHADELQIGFDGQISNWAIAGFDAGAPELGEDIELVYFDTSSPLMRKAGREQLDPELFLRSAPSFMIWIIRLLFLKEVMTRYYDLRRVMIDLVANFFKEGRADRVPQLVETVNAACAADIQAGRFKPITQAEVAAYYREDARIWKVYFAFRKFDRFLHRLSGREYPYILPEKIER